MKLKQLGYGLSAIALSASIIPIGNVFAENEACTADYVGEACVASSVTELNAGLTNTNVKTVKIINDITKSGIVTANHGVTLDLAGFEIKTTENVDAFEVTSGSFVVKDTSEAGTGKISSRRNIFVVDGENTELVLESGALETTGTYGIFGKQGASVYVKGGSIEAHSTAISSNNTTGDVNVYISGGQVISASGATAIYLPSQQDLWVSGGEIYGSMVVRMGDVQISGGTFYASSNIDEPTATNCDGSGRACLDYSGSAWFPATLSLVVGHASYKSENARDTQLDVKITGGKFVAVPTETENGNYGNTSKWGGAIALYDVAKTDQTVNISVEGGEFVTGKTGDDAWRKAYSTFDRKTILNEDGTADNSVDGFIRGGTFDVEPDSRYVANNYKSVESDGTYTVYPLVTELSLGYGEKEVELLSGESQAMRINYTPKGAVVDFEVSTDKPELFEGETPKIEISDGVYGVIFNAAYEGTGEAVITVTEKNSGKTASVNVKVTEVLKSDVDTAEDGTTAIVYFENPIEGDNLALEVAKAEMTDENKAKISPFLKAVYDISVVDQDTNETVSVKDNRIDVMLALDAADYEGMKYFKVVYIDENGKLAETFDTEVQTGEDSIALFFTTTHLSAYGVLASETEFPEVLSPDTGAFTAEAGAKIAGAVVAATIVAIVTMAGVVVKMHKR